MTNSSERPKVGLAKSKARAVAPGSAVKMPAAIDEAALLGDLRTLVQSARQRIATAAYSTQTLLCWHMGRRLDREHLQGGRAAYGKQILVTVSRELTAEYGRGFSPADSYGFAPGDPRNRPLTATAFLPRRDGGPCRVFRTIAEPPRAKFKSRR